MSNYTANSANSYLAALLGSPCLTIHDDEAHSDDQLCHHQYHLFQGCRKAIARNWVLHPLDGKKPAHDKWERKRVCSESEALAWILAGHNIGILAGPASGILIIDTDPDRGGVIPAELANIITPSVCTGGGGMHLYFRWPACPIQYSKDKLGPGIEVLVAGRQAVFPGSIHPETLKPYCWAPGRSPDEVPLADLPQPFLDKLLAIEAGKAVIKPRSPSRPATPLPEAAPFAALTFAALTPYHLAALTRECRALAMTPKGFRHKQLLQSAQRLCRFGPDLLPLALIQSALLDAGQQCGLPKAEILNTVKGVWKWRSSPKYTPIAAAATTLTRADIDEIAKSLEGGDAKTRLPEFLTKLAARQGRPDLFVSELDAATWCRFNCRSTAKRALARLVAAKFMVVTRPGKKGWQATRFRLTGAPPPP